MNHRCIDQTMCTLMHHVIFLEDTTIIVQLPSLSQHGQLPPPWHGPHQQPHPQPQHDDYNGHFTVLTQAHRPHIDGYYSSMPRTASPITQPAPMSTTTLTQPTHHNQDLDMTTTMATAPFALQMCRSAHTDGHHHSMRMAFPTAFPPMHSGATPTTTTTSMVQ